MIPRHLSRRESSRSYSERECAFSFVTRRVQGVGHMTDTLWNGSAVRPYHVIERKVACEI